MSIDNQHPLAGGTIVLQNASVGAKLKERA